MMPRSSFRPWAETMTMAGATKGPAATGYYLHLEPGASFFTGGLWQPEPVVAARIRGAIDAHAQRWVEIRDALGCVGRLGPQDVDPDEPTT